MAKKIVIKRGDGGGGEPDEPEDVYEEEFEDTEEDSGGLKLSKGGSASSEWVDAPASSGVGDRYAGGDNSGKEIRLNRSAKKGVTYRKARSGPAKVRSGSASQATKAKNRSTKASGGKGPMLFGAVILITVVIGVVYVFAKVAHGATAGTMGSVQGNVTVTHKGSVAVAELDMRVRSGSTIEVRGEGSQAYFMYPDGGRIEIEPGTKVEVGVTEQNIVYFKGKWIKLREGEIFVKAPMQHPEFPMKIYAGPGSGYARGTINEATFGMAFTNEIVYTHVTGGSMTLTDSASGVSKDVPERFYAYISARHVFEPRDITGKTQVSRLAIIEAGTGVAIDRFSPLRSGILVDMQEIPSHIAIQAYTAPETVGSVRFQMTGVEKIVTVENSAPYTFRGEANAPLGGAWEPTNGEYTLKVWAYSLKDGKGKRSAPKMIKMTVVGAR